MSIYDIDKQELECEKFRGRNSHEKFPPITTQ